MAIVTISNLSFIHGKEIAETLAEKLGYEFMSWYELRTSASKQFNLPEIELARYTEKSTSLLDRITGGKRSYNAYTQSVFFKSIAKDNIVYHGFAGHILVRGIPNILKELITTSEENRIKTLMDIKGSNDDKAEKNLEKIDAARTKWIRQIYKIEIEDPGHYDMVLRIDNMTIDIIVDYIIAALNLPCFQTTSITSSMLSDRALSSEIKTNLLEDFPSTKIRSVKDGKVIVVAEVSMEDQETISADLEKMLKGIKGIKDFEIDFETRSRMTSWT